MAYATDDVDFAEVKYYYSKYERETTGLQGAMQDTDEAEGQRIVDGWEFSREDGVFTRAEEWLADPESRIQDIGPTDDEMSPEDSPAINPTMDFEPKIAESDASGEGQELSRVGSRDRHNDIVPGRGSGVAKMAHRLADEEIAGEAIHADDPRRIAGESDDEEFAAESERSHPPHNDIVPGRGTMVAKMATKEWKDER